MGTREFKEVEPRLTLIVGVSGSGKSTWAKKEFDKDPLNTVIIGRDTIRKMLFGWQSIEDETNYYKLPNLQKLEKMVSNYQDELIRTSLSKRKHVIVDNTHLKMKYINEYKKYNVRTDLVFVFEDVENCIIRRRYFDKNLIKKQFENFKSLVKNLLNVNDFKISRVLSLGNYSTHKKKFIKNHSRVKTIVVDIDGTVALRGDRSPYDYTKVSGDLPNEKIISTIDCLADSYHIIFCSGREDSCKEDTLDWLKKNLFDINHSQLYMRKTGDHRPDYIVKQEMWEKIQHEGYNIFLLVDDRKQVIDTARDLGYTVLDVANNTF